MEKTIIEINGIKMEVDLRTAKVVDTYKVGDRVKLLLKSYNGYTDHYGVIVGFDAFANLPTIVVCYLTNDYTGDVKFAHINSETKDQEIVIAGDEMQLEQQDILDRLDRAVNKAEVAWEEAKSKRAYFLNHYNRIAGIV